MTWRMLRTPRANPVPARPRRRLLRLGLGVVRRLRRIHFRADARHCIRRDHVLDNAEAIALDLRAPFEQSRHRRKSGSTPASTFSNSAISHSSRSLPGARRKGVSMRPRRCRINL